MLSIIRKWFGGIEVSAVTLVLPFVELTLTPAEQTITKNGEVKFVKNTRTREISTRQVYLNILNDSTNSFITDGLIRRAIAFRSPYRIEAFWEDYGTYSIGFNTRFDGHRKFRDYPLFGNKPWSLFSGKIEVYSNELLWIAAMYQNVTSRVLYNVPVSLNTLPFLKGLNGYVYSSAGGSWVADVTIEQLVPYINSNETSVVHCFCVVPANTKFSRRVAFQNYWPEEPRNYTWTNEKPKAIDYRLYIESLIQQQFSEVEFISDLRYERHLQSVRVKPHRDGR